MKTFNKILIANRGEIAVRIIRACHELGVKAVAVYSETDRTAMHVREADEAYPIGPSPASDSYLVQERLIQTALDSSCQAIHPGYGFLAENSEFARKVLDAGLVYIGSSPESIRLLGDKVESRRAMAKAGVPITPGITVETDLSDNALEKAAERIGFPVLVKAAGGGGGKGMRVVDDPALFHTSLQAARREAQSAFGNPTVYVEKYIVEPRHIEFQIFGDQHGHRIHLFERECSVQRRHQKIIEESPSVALDDPLRSKMGAAAVAVAEAAGYYNAGTVEFLLDRDRNFYFLEVNTRIQVEHPVTEMVVGVDLVKEQIRVACGAELSWAQSELSQRGHAVEARIYAEDAAHGFLPAPGPVYFLEEPIGPGLRWDGGVQTGDEVSLYYDPIVAKLIAWGADRTEALGRLRTALNHTVVLGLTTNIEFLKAVLDHPEFISGNLTTSFLQHHIPDWSPSSLSENEMLILAGLTSLASRKSSNGNNNDVSDGQPDPWLTVGAWQVGSGAGR